MKYNSIDFYVATHPVRLDLLIRIDYGKAYAADLAATKKMNRKVVAFHLDKMEKAGILKSEYGLSPDSKPVAVKYYQITEKGKHIVADLLSIFKQTQSNR